MSDKKSLSSNNYYLRCMLLTHFSSESYVCFEHKIMVLVGILKTQKSKIETHNLQRKKNQENKEYNNINNNIIIHVLPCLHLVDFFR